MQGARERGMTSLFDPHPGRERELKGEKAGWRQDVFSPSLAFFSVY